MKLKVPRIVLAGTNSGCGKTTVSCAILQALVNRGLKTGAFKCGPDYIDPMFHSRIIGAESTNLDSFFFSENTLKYLLAKNGAGRDISIIEGVMGFYDGMRMSDSKASTYDVSQITQSPVILVVGAKGASLSVLAIIQGFLSLCPDNNICGVILNQCSAMTYKMIAPQIEKHFGGRVTALGYMPFLPGCVFESRHLGLITAAEVENLREKLRSLAKCAEETIDIDAVIKLAQSAPDVSFRNVLLPKQEESVKIAVAYDNAFCFYYRDSLDALSEMGAEIVYFSPLNNDKLPEDIHGICLGGGYPELYAEKLSKNKSMLTSVKNALESGIPCIAECGGFMYLTEEIGGHPMVGYLRGKCFDTGKLSRFGYITLKAREDNLLCKKGDKIAAHEFHYWDCGFPGEDFTAEKESGRKWDCAVSSGNLYAGFPHFHFYANTDFANNFYQACLKEKHRHD